VSGVQKSTGGSFELSRATVLVSQGGGALLPSTSFTSRVFVDGNRSLFDASLSDLTLFGQAFCETYKSLNALNFRICDTNERVITFVAATVQEADDDGTASPPFSIVFNIVGSCRGCGQATVVFGDHVEASPGDTTATCPAGAEFGCPAEAEFQDALQDTIDRLQQEDELTIVDTMSTKRMNLARRCPPSLLFHPRGLPLVLYALRTDKISWVNMLPISVKVHLLQQGAVGRLARGMYRSPTLIRCLVVVETDSPKHLTRKLSTGMCRVRPA
jgi:hypothetical protein